MLDETFKIAIIILAVVVIILFIIIIIMIKKMTEERRFQNSWLGDLKKDYIKDVKESKMDMAKIVKAFYGKVGRVSEIQYKDLNKILEAETTHITNKINSFQEEIKNFETKLGEIKPQIEELRVLETENKDLRKENRKLQNTLDRISPEYKKIKKANNG